jgi:hypothetical protein
LSSPEPARQQLDDDALIELDVERVDHEPVVSTQDGADAVLAGDEVARV